MERAFDFLCRHLHSLRGVVRCFERFAYGRAFRQFVSLPGVWHSVSVFGFRVPVLSVSLE